MTTENAINQSDYIEQTDRLSKYLKVASCLDDQLEDISNEKNQVWTEFTKLSAEVEQIKNDRQLLKHNRKKKQLDMSALCSLTSEFYNFQQFYIDKTISLEQDLQKLQEILQETEESFQELVQMSEVMKNCNLDLKSHFDEQQRPIFALQEEVDSLSD